ncbi:MAG TPA: peptide-methionine (S)-S-oxide reductase MsrA [Fimbriimonadaceae bacterium]|nr:peptide-methionine (S)-S-oxide reductase MsrA [Fimbriimonadaceae bacterium]
MKSLAIAIVVLGAGAGGWLGFRGTKPAQNPVPLDRLSDADSARVGSNPGGILSGGKLKPTGNDQLAAFSGGCFWGTENQFRHVKGVVATAVGYTGGTVDHPSYEQVCQHTTGHAESVLIEFDPTVVTYRELLHDFWLSHDPTTLDRQGPDIGNNYRSAIWTFSSEQQREAAESRDAQQKLEHAKFVTEIAPIGTFWIAESYHQQYDEKTGTNTCPAPRHVG